VLQVRVQNPVSNGRPTGKDTCSFRGECEWQHKNRVLGEERRRSDRVILVDCLVKLRIDRLKLLACFWIDCVVLLGKGWRSKADCQPY